MVATLGLMPPIPAMRKYVSPRSKRGENTSAATVTAALISEGSKNQRGAWELVSGLGIRTSLPCYELTNIVVGSAVDVRKAGGEARNGDVLGEQVELRDPIPDFSL